MLENYIKPDAAMGAAGLPMAGLVFHYDNDGSSGVAETAGLCSLGIPTRVLVPPTNLHNLQKRYAALPHAEDSLEVMPLCFQSHHLTIERMMKLMAFAESNGPVPLYVNVVTNLLRKLALQRPGKALDYDQFRNELETNKDFVTNQSSMLRMRLDLLESCLASRLEKNPGQKFTVVDFTTLIRPGTLTIVDLSWPLTERSSARTFFDIILGLSKEHRPQSGLVVALDEAHKFINDSSGTSEFTKRLMSTIREQRHVGIRVLIATQEPTISPRLLDLCNVSIIHRFSSPAWLAAIKSHLGAAQLHERQSNGADDGLMQELMHLRVGESPIFAPSSYLCVQDGQPRVLQNGIMKMKTRKRLGNDQVLTQLADRPILNQVNI